MLAAPRMLTRAVALGRVVVVGRRGRRPTGAPTGSAVAPVGVGDHRDRRLGDARVRSGIAGAFPGIQIDAVVSRQLAEAPKLIRGMLKKGTLRDTVLLGLGTNGPIDEKTLEDIRTLATPARHIVVVNVQAPRGWTPRVNESLTPLRAAVPGRGARQLAGRDLRAPSVSRPGPDPSGAPRWPHLRRGGAGCAAAPRRIAGVRAERIPAGAHSALAARFSIQRTRRADSLRGRRRPRSAPERGLQKRVLRCGRCRRHRRCRRRRPPRPDSWPRQKRRPRTAAASSAALRRPRQRRPRLRRGSSTAGSSTLAAFGALVDTLGAGAAFSGSSTSSICTMGALSPLRKPSLVMRV